MFSLQEKKDSQDPESDETSNGNNFRKKIEILQEELNSNEIKTDELITDILKDKK